MYIVIIQQYTCYVVLYSAYIFFYGFFCLIKTS